MKDPELMKAVEEVLAWYDLNLVGVYQPFEKLRIAYEPYLPKE